MLQGVWFSAHCLFTYLFSLNPNKARLFEGSFSWGWRGGGGVNLTPSPPSHFKKNLSNFNETLYNC